MSLCAGERVADVKACVDRGYRQLLDVRISRIEVSNKTEREVYFRNP